MTIFLFTDFGAADLYVGQVKAVLAREAPGVPVVDLLHEAPVFNARASAHLLAALFARMPVGSVTLAVVDPGVGGQPVHRFDRVDAARADCDAPRSVLSASSRRLRFHHGVGQGACLAR